MNFSNNPRFVSAPSQSRRASNKAKGFTLVEILVVLSIIAILAALLFPAFKGAQENGKQTNCASNLQQIYMAVKQYYDDEKKYPANVAVLLPNTEMLDTTPAVAGNTVSAPITNSKGTGYLKSAGNMVCPDDDTNNPGVLRSSYSNVGTIQPPLPAPVTPSTSGVPDASTMDVGRFVWNYWGYNAEGFAYNPPNDPAYFGDVSDPTSITGHGATDTTAGAKRYLRNPDIAFNATSNPVDPQKLPRLANRYAPEDTIITHCVYHRMPTSNLAKSTDIYTDTANSGGARDIVLRLSGQAIPVDVTTWKGDKWNKQIR